MDTPVYSTSKDFSLFGEKKTILLHNGCGLRSALSICNALILKGLVVLDGQFTEEAQVISFLRKSLLEICSDKLKDQVGDAIESILAKSLKPAWNAITSFEKNALVDILHELQINVYHGWVISDQNAEAKFHHEITDSSSAVERAMADLKGAITDCGLKRLEDTILNQDICILLHNNIIDLATKIDDKLYVLNTNQSLNNAGRFWHKLSDSIIERKREREGENALETHQDGLNEDSIYRTSTDTSFFGKMTTILFNNGKGSESLVAFCNALILNGVVVLDGQFTEEAQVISFLRKSLLEICSDKLKDQVGDAIESILAKSLKPAWNAITSFEMNALVDILHELQINVYHGWVISDQNAEAKFHHEITDSSSAVERAMADLKGAITDYGLKCLKDAIRNQDICILLHDSSFHTATKIDDEICVLITDTRFNGSGRFWKAVSGSSVGAEHIGEGAEEGVGEELIGEGEELIGEGEGLIGEGEGLIGEGEVVGVGVGVGEGVGVGVELGAEIGEGGEAADSDDSMTTHVGGQATPTEVLERRSSSSNDDFSSSNDDF